MTSINIRAKFSETSIIIDKMLEHQFIALSEATIIDQFKEIMAWPDVARKEFLNKMTSPQAREIWDAGGCISSLPNFKVVRNAINA
jgi:hypothetical protein